MRVPHDLPAAFIELPWTLTHLCALVWTQYKRADVGMLAFNIQAILCLLLLASLYLVLFTSLEQEDVLGLASRVLGFRSRDNLVATMIAITLSFLGGFVMLTLYQTVWFDELGVLRLAGSRRLPELSFFPKMLYHVFLSHIWSSGQDQVAVIKRKHQLVLPGCQCFLDVDDLEDIGQLEQYVLRSHCVLIFLSKGYFFSKNCLRELDCALQKKKPLILVHEADFTKGGAPLAILRADCESQERDAARLFHDLSEIISWHRIAAFQLVSLKMIAERVLHASPAYQHLFHPPTLEHAGEIAKHEYAFQRRVCIYVSRYNPGARAIMDEYVQRYGDENLTIQTQLAPAKLQRESAMNRMLLPSELYRMRRSTRKVSRSLSEKMPAMSRRMSEGEDSRRSSWSSGRSSRKNSRKLSGMPSTDKTPKAVAESVDDQGILSTSLGRAPESKGVASSGSAAGPIVCSPRRCQSEDARQSGSTLQPQQAKAAFAHGVRPCRRSPMQAFAHAKSQGGARPHGSAKSLHGMLSRLAPQKFTSFESSESRRSLGINAELTHSMRRRTRKSPVPHR